MRATLERVASRLHSRPTLWSRGLRARLVVWLGAGLATLASAATNGAEATPRAIVIAPYDTSSLAADEQWMGEAVAQVISLGLVWQQGLVQIEPARFRSVVDPIVWDETHVAQAARAVRADTALHGTIVRKDSGLLLQPRLLDLKSGQPTPLPPMAFTEAETIEAYSKAIELRPFYADAHAGLGDAHVAKGDVSLAVYAYQRAIAFDPFNPRTHVRLGRAYAAKGRCTDAANEHRRAGELDPHYAAVPAPCPTNTP